MLHDKLTNIHQIQAFYFILSERARLIEMIVFDKLVTKDQHLLMIEDLLSLCRNDFEVMYRFKNELIDELCSICRIKFSKKAHDRSDHIHTCRQNELMTNINQQSLLSESIHVQYCFFCFR
jgi:hypothetical protein